MMWNETGPMRVRGGFKRGIIYSSDLFVMIATTRAHSFNQRIALTLLHLLASFISEPFFFFEKKRLYNPIWFFFFVKRLYNPNWFDRSKLQLIMHAFTSVYYMCIVLWWENQTWTKNPSNSQKHSLGQSVVGTQI